MKKVVLAVLIATLMIASRPMTTEAADQPIDPIYTDVSVKKDLAKDDEHVPIYCTWSGNWVDQHGHDVSWYEGEKYLTKHPVYAAKVYKINIKLFWTPNSGRSSDLERLQKQADFASYSNFDYQFVDEAAQELTDNGIVIMKVLPNFQLSTVKAYLEWSGNEAELIPLLKTESGWLNQFGNEMDQKVAEDFLKQHEDYREMLEQLMLTAQLAELSQNEIRSELEETYSKWFIQQMRERNSIIDKTMKRIPKLHKPGEAQKEVEATEQTITPPKKEVDVSLDYNALTEYIVSCDRSIYGAYVAKMRSVAIESLRGNEVWCDACYTLFKTDLSNPENRWALGRIFTDNGDIGKYKCILSGVLDTPDDIIVYREHDITFFQGRKVFCLEGHMVGKVHGSDIDYSGPFADAINQKLEELLEK